MAIRLAGMVSGMDTDSMVQELVKAYSKKKDTMVSTQTKLSWKQDAWKSMNTKIYSFYSKSLDNMRFSSSYKKKTTSVSDTTKATVVAGDGAVSGSQNLAVKQLATAGYLTGGKIEADASGNKPTANTKLSDLGITSNTSFTVTNAGKEYTVNLNTNSTLSEVAEQITASGLGASYDAANQRFFVNATGTGADKDFSLTADSTAAADVMSSLGLMAASDVTDNAAYKTYSDYVVFEADGTTVNNSATLANMQSLIDDTVESRTNAYNKTITDSQKKIDDMNKYLEDGVADDGTTILGAYSKANLNATYQAAKAKLTDLSAAELEDQYGITADSTALESTKIATILKKDLEKANAEGSAATELDKTHLQAASDLATNISNAEINKNSAADLKTTATNKLATVQEDTENEYLNRAIAANTLYNNPPTGSGTAVRIKGQDAEIFLNNAKFTSSTNTFSINGLTITAKATTGLTTDAAGATGAELDKAENYNTVGLTTDIDVDGIYDGIKNMLKEYNTLIKEMDTAYNADSSKGYEPLTDEEKDAMTDTEIEKWEKKIKDALLRRDDTLDGVTSAMKNAMAATFTINGKTTSLSTYGISTMSYFLSADNEKGVFHIDGDKDDAVTSTETDKLKTAIAADPEAVGSFFQKLTSGLYDALSKKMSSTSMSSAYTVYNDKEMKTEYSDYTKKISEQEKKLAAIEDKYYKQFAAMEKAMAQMNSSQSALSSMLGG